MCELTGSRCATAESSGYSSQRPLDTFRCSAYRGCVAQHSSVGRKAACKGAKQLVPGLWDSVQSSMREQSTDDSGTRPSVPSCESWGHLTCMLIAVILPGHTTTHLAKQQRRSCAERLPQAAAPQVARQMLHHAILPCKPPASRRRLVAVLGLLLAAAASAPGLVLRSPSIGAPTPHRRSNCPRQESPLWRHPLEGSQHSKLWVC